MAFQLAGGNCIGIITNFFFVREQKRRLPYYHISLMMESISTAIITVGAVVVVGGFFPNRINIGFCLSLITLICLYCYWTNYWQIWKLNSQNGQSTAYYHFHTHKNDRLFQLSEYYAVIRQPMFCSIHLHPFVLCRIKLLLCFQSKGKMI